MHKKWPLYIILKLIAILFFPYFVLYLEDKIKHRKVYWITSVEINLLEDHNKYLKELCSDHYTNDNVPLVHHEI